MDAYDPTDIGANYLGDLGSSTTHGFGFVIPKSSQLVIVVNSVFGFADCDYSFSIENFPCFSDVLPIPTISEYGLLVLGGLILVAMIIFFRRRARQTA